MKTMRAAAAVLATIAVASSPSVRARDSLRADRPVTAERSPVSAAIASPLVVKDAVRAVVAESDATRATRPEPATDRLDPMLSAALDRAPQTCSALRIVAVGAAVVACTASNRCSYTPAPATRRDFCKVNRFW